MIESILAYILEGIIVGFGVFIWLVLGLIQGPDRPHEYLPAFIKASPILLLPVAILLYLNALD